MNEEWIAKAIASLTLGGAGVWTGVFMFAAYMAREWRETSKLSADDRDARRQGYAAQVEQLMRENRAIGEDQRALRAEYDKYRALCQAETDQLRDQVIALEFELAGFRREAATHLIQMAKGVGSPRVIVEPSAGPAKPDT